MHGHCVAPCRKGVNGYYNQLKQSTIIEQMIMINITEAAQAHFAKLLENQEPGTQIRVFVINPGTPTAECGVSYCPPGAVEATDKELKFEKLSAYVDEISAPFLDDAEIDFVTDQLGSQLTLKAPNAKMRKVSDDAPLIERVGMFYSHKLTHNLPATVAVFP